MEFRSVVPPVVLSWPWLVLEPPRRESAVAVAHGTCKIVCFVKIVLDKNPPKSKPDWAETVNP